MTTGQPCSWGRYFRFFLSLHVLLNLYNVALGIYPMAVSQLLSLQAISRASFRLDQFPALHHCTKYFLTVLGLLVSIYGSLGTTHISNSTTNDTFFHLHPPTFSLLLLSVVNLNHFFLT